MPDAESGKQSLGWLAGAGTLLSLAACYGTLGVVAALSLMGITLAVNVHVWAAAIVLFAAVAATGSALGYKRHGNAAPVAIAIIGALLVTASTYGEEAIRSGLGLSARVVELIGFAGLVSAAVWDWRLKKGSGKRQGEAV